jgi:hypothetical protein
VACDVFRVSVTANHRDVKRITVGFQQTNIAKVEGADKNSLLKDLFEDRVEVQ